MTTDADTDPDDTAEPAYSFKPAMLGAPQEFRLAADALECRSGRRLVRIPYAEIRRVRLSFRPIALQQNRFLTEIWPAAGLRAQIVSTSWRSIVEQARQDAPYAAFVTALHQRIAKAAPAARFETGTPPVLYWTGLVVFSLIVLAMAVLIVRALLEGNLAGAAFVAAFLAFSLWQIGGYFIRNRPGTYRPDTLPPHLIPK